MGCRLLIAEDEKYLREKVTKNIDWVSHDFILFAAGDGEEALEILQKENIDILVTDIRMPGMSGIELTEKAKQIKKDLRVIVISGHAEFELAQASIRLGVEDYLLKPFRSERLLEVVKATRQKLREANQARLERFLVHDGVPRRLFDDKMSDIFSWLADPSFFVNQSKASIRNGLGEVLKSGTASDLSKEIDVLYQIMDQLQSDKKNLYILLNNVVIATLTTLKDVGFDFDHGISVMTKHLPATSDGRLAELKEWIKKFLFDINAMIKAKQNEGTEQLIRQIKDHVDQNYRKGVSLSALASHFNVSLGYLSKLFLEYVGENFTDYVNSLKANKAKELLKTTDKRIYEIADYLGFNDAYYFSSWFKRTVGCSPTEYRDNLIQYEDRPHV